MFNPIPTKEAANKCSNDVVKRHRMCAGCYGDAYCNVSKKWRQAYPDNLLDKVIIAIASSGAK